MSGTPRVHVADYEGRPARRPLTRAELQAFFDAADDRVESAASSPAGRAGWRRSGTRPCSRSVYAFGLRRREVAMLDVTDFTVNPAAPELGVLGALPGAVRQGDARLPAAAPGRSRR